VIKRLVAALLALLLLVPCALASAEAERELAQDLVLWLSEKVRQAREPDPYLWRFECETEATVEDVADVAQILRELGVEGIDAQAEETIRAWIEDFAAAGFEATESRESIALSLLNFAGMGELDETTWQFVPNNRTVFAFDLEVMDVLTMYATFLKGVETIGCGELVFSDVSETPDALSLHTGAGLREVRFSLNGEAYALTAREDRDWFDANMLEAVCEIVNAQAGERRLYFVLDGYQGCILFYNTPQWAQRFTQETGIPLFTHL